MNTRQYRQQDRQFLWHPYSRHSAMESQPFPVMTRGDGIYLFDSDGRRYLDAISSWWACNLGHGHPRLVQALQRQASELQHSMLGNMSHPRAIELAAELTACLGSSPRRVFFSGDGASAVEAALKIAVQYWYNVGRPGRYRFVSLEHAYHGDTLGAVSVGYQEAFHRPFQPLMLPVCRAEAPFCAGCRWTLTPAACRLECMTSLASILDAHADEIAAVIVEPLCQGAAGMRLYAPACLTRLAGLCRQHHILLIVDEIAMGFGRTGKMFAFQHAGIDPDIVCLGKGLAGGYLPISATVVKEFIFNAFHDQPEDHTFYHGHTFAGNPVAAAVALEMLRVYRDDAIVECAQRMGRMLEAHMRRFIGLRGVRRVRSLGLIAALDLETLQGQPDAVRAQAMREDLLSKGILIRPLGHVVYIMPPLIISEPELTVLVDAVYQSVRRTA